MTTVTFRRSPLGALRALPASLALAALAVLPSASCALQGQPSNVGLECADSGDCDDDTLGCVPVDDQEPAGDRVCMPPAGDWTCQGKFFGDGACDCGCAFADVDCPDASSSSCAVDGNNCPSGKNPIPDDNTRCQ